MFNVNPNHPSWTAPLSAADGVDASYYGVQTGSHLLQCSSLQNSNAVAYLKAWYKPIPDTEM